MRATSFLLAAAQLAAAHAFVAPRAWARRPAPTAVSENAQQGWTEYYDEASGVPYWYNATSGETSWTDPNGGGGDQVGYAEGYGSDYAEGAQGYDTGGDGGGNYTEYYDEATGAAYWYNDVTGETLWEDPNGGY